MSIREQGHDSLGHASIKTRSSRAKSSKELSNRQKKFLRKLVNVLLDVVDEKEFVDDGDDDKAERSEEDRRGANYRVGRNVLPDGTAQRYEKLTKFEPKTYLALSRCREVHAGLAQQVQALLRTLGGGYRTAKATETIHDDLSNVVGSFVMRDSGSLDLDARGCAVYLGAFSKSIEETIKAFMELGVFNTRFYEKLEDLLRESRDVMNKLQWDYGHDGPFYYTCAVHEYLDSLFIPFVKNLESYVQELTGIAEREIPMIRQSQDFTSQRYLNLTTIATFLSSVTATTLQISADGPTSTLNTVTNSMWFVSLVFSSASAVYSLLVMTWRQSSVRRPDLSLPPSVDSWLRNAPMVSLIASLTTFSIGLCLLAFLVADQQGGVVPAAVPTSLAGLHAYSIFCLSIWYLFEQWKARHTKDWNSVKNKYLVVATATIVKVPREMVSRIYCQCKGLATPLIVRFSKAKFPSIQLQRSSQDMELGRRASSGHSTDDEVPVNMDSRQSPEPDKAPSPVTQPAAPDPSAAVIDKAPSITDPPKRSSGASESLSSRPESNDFYQELLHFSPDCTFLASASSNVVTIYDADNSFKVLSTIVVPGGIPIQQISWDPNEDEAVMAWERHAGIKSQQGHLLVRSSNGVSVWRVIPREDGCDVNELSRLDISAAPVRWTYGKSTGFAGFSCLVDHSLKVFDNTCEELESWDLSVIPNIQHVFDAGLVMRDKIVCLATTKVDVGGRVLVIDRDSKAVQGLRNIYIGPAPKYLVISEKFGRILVLDGLQDTYLNIITLQGETEKDGHYSSWCSDFFSGSLTIRVGTAGFLGKGGDMAFLIADSQVSMIYKLENGFYKSFHFITTPDSKAMVQRCTSFAIGVNNFSPLPYLFAFRDEDGSVKIWSIQSNDALRWCESAEDFEVHDRLGGERKDPLLSVGKFLTLPPPNAAGA